MSKISEFQIYISGNAPFNIEYKVKKLGVMDNDLFSALRKIENEISSITNVKGMIVSNENKRIVGDLGDVKKAVNLVVGFRKNAQANLDALDMTLDEEIPTAAKSQLSADEALSQFESVTPTESQQIGRSHVDAVGGGEVCGKCQSPIKADICDKCGNRNRVGFLVSEYLKKIAELTSNFDEALSMLLGANITKEDVKSWQSKNASVMNEDILNKYWDIFLDNRISAFNYSGQILIYKNRQDNIENELRTYETVEKSVYLTGDNKIPRLWMYFINFRVTGSDEEVPDTELAKSTSVNLVQDYYLLEGLGKLFGELVKSPRFIDIVKTFAQENKSKINEIRGMFQSTPTYLGGGVDGSVFSIGPNLVLKLFRDKYSYETALQAVHRLHKEPELAKTEAMIYDVGVLGIYPASYRPTDVYYYVMEKMKPVINFDDESAEYKLREILAAINFYIMREKNKWSELRKKIQDPKNHNEIKQQVLKSVEQISGSIKSKKLLKEYIVSTNETYPKLKDNWLELLVEEVIIKYLTGRTDLHVGNLGVTNYGEFRYFDPSYERATEDINLPEEYHAANRRLVDERFVKLAEIVGKY